MLFLREDKEAIENGAMEKIEWVHGSRGKIFGLHKHIEEGQGAEVCLIMSAGFDATHGNQTFNCLKKNLAEVSLSTYRYDYFGRGLSDGRENELKYSTSVNDLNIVLDNLRRKYGYQKFVLLGCSYGGLVSARVAADRQNKEDIAWLVMKCPVSDFKQLTVLMFSRDDIDQALRECHDLVYQMDGETRRIGWPALKELFGDEVDRMIDLKDSINVPVDIVVGNRDVLAGLRDLSMVVNDWRGRGVDVDYQEIEGADHFFSRESDFKQMIDVLTKKIKNFTI